jgi:multiple sugar transport system permease protein
MTNEMTIKMNTTQSEPKMRKQRKKKYIGYYFVALLVLAFILVPIYIMVITSLMTELETDNAYFSWWPQMGMTLDAYDFIFEKSVLQITLIDAFWNTMWIYFPSTVVGVFMSAMAAYSFAKLDFKLKKPMFAILMATLTLPNCMSMIASVIMFDGIGWLNSPLPLIVPRMLGTIGVVFFLKQFYAGIPDDLIGAGYIDGLDELGVFFRILLPISMPALVSQIVLQFIGAYNDYLAPLLYLQDERIYTLQIALAYYKDPVKDMWNVRMAAAVVAMAPLVILYLIGQKYILKGVAITTGLKG